jgi:hypothetical protein
MALQILQNSIDEALESLNGDHTNIDPNTIRNSLIKTAETLYIVAENQMQDAKRKGKVWLEGYFATEKKEIGEFIESLKRAELGEFEHGGYEEKI